MSCRGWPSATPSSPWTSADSGALNRGRSPTMSPLAPTTCTGWSPSLALARCCSPGKTGAGRQRSRSRRPIQTRYTALPCWRRCPPARGPRPDQAAAVPGSPAFTRYPTFRSAWSPEGSAPTSTGSSAHSPRLPGCRRRRRLTSTSAATPARAPWPQPLPATAVPAARSSTTPSTCPGRSACRSWRSAASRPSGPRLRRTCATVRPACARRSSRAAGTMWPKRRPEEVAGLLLSFFDGV